MFRRLWGRPRRREAAVAMARTLQSIIGAIATNDPKRALDLWHELEQTSSNVHTDDFTILRNHFLANVKVNCEDRLNLAYDFDRWRLAHHVPVNEHVFGFRYHQTDMQLVAGLADLPVPPLPPSEEMLRADAPAETDGIQPQELWVEGFAKLNSAFFRDRLCRPARFSWKELGVLSRTEWLFTEDGIRFHVQLHHRLQASNLCLGILLHELIHVWDATTWKPLEPSWTPAGHGGHWTAKAEQIQMALKAAHSPLMVNLTDDIPTRPQPPPQHRRHWLAPNFTPRQRDGPPPPLYAHTALLLLLSPAYPGARVALQVCLNPHPSEGLRVAVARHTIRLLSSLGIKVDAETDRNPPTDRAMQIPDAHPLDRMFSVPDDLIRLGCCPDPGGKPPWDDDPAEASPSLSLLTRRGQRRLAPRLWAGVAAIDGGASLAARGGDPQGDLPPNPPSPAVDHLLAQPRGPAPPISPLRVGPRWRASRRPPAAHREWHPPPSTDVVPNGPATPPPASAARTAPAADPWGHRRPGALAPPIAAPSPPPCAPPTSIGPAESGTKEDASPNPPPPPSRGRPAAADKRGVSTPDPQAAVPPFVREYYAQAARLKDRLRGQDAAPSRRWPVDPETGGLARSVTLAAGQRGWRWEAQAGFFLPAPFRARLAAEEPPL